MVHLRSHDTYFMFIFIVINNFICQKKLQNVFWNILLINTKDYRVLTRRDVRHVYVTNRVLRIRY